MNLKEHGAHHHAQALSRNELLVFKKLADRYKDSGPGARINGDDQLDNLLSPLGTLQKIAKIYLGDGAAPVRAVLFDKNSRNNWSLGWHQDRTIALREKHETKGFNTWSVKSGIVHVEPSFSYIDRMITLRAHLDDCDEENAPLKIAKGSHKLGRVSINKIGEVVASSKTIVCLAKAGDVWAYATAILHASDASKRPGNRRVLQVDYSSSALPHGLVWLGT